MNNVESIKASEILENYTQAKENICKETRNSIARLKQGLEAKAQQFLYQNQEIVDALRNDQLPQGSNANRQKYLDVLLVAQAILKNATDQYGLAYDSKNSHVDPKRRILNLDGTLTRKLFPIFNQFKITKNTTLMELKE